MNKPLLTKNVVDKEVALICLGWAQAKLDEKVPILNYALLKYSHNVTEKTQRAGKVTVVVLELTSKEKNNQMPKVVRKGAVLKFMVLRTNELLQIPWVSSISVLFQNEYVILGQNKGS